MKLIEVNNRAAVKEFHKVPHIVYKGDDIWVCPLEDEVEAQFTPGLNNFFSHGEAARWILKNDKGELIGRVAAFINNHKAYTFQQPTGGMGSFECIRGRGGSIHAV